MNSKIYLSVFELFLSQWIMSILSKGCKPDNFESHDSLRQIFEAFIEILLNVNFSLKFGWLSWFWQFICEGSSFNLKGFYYSYACSCSLCEGRTSFCVGLVTKKLGRFLFDSDSQSPALLDFFLLVLLFVLQWLSLYWEILIMFLSQFPLTFRQNENGIPCFTAKFLSILLIGMVFMIT